MIATYHLTHLYSTNKRGTGKIIVDIYKLFISYTLMKKIFEGNDETLMFKLSADIVFPFLFFHNFYFNKLRLHNYQNIQK